MDGDPQVTDGNDPTAIAAFVRQAATEADRRSREGNTPNGLRSGYQIIASETKETVMLDRSTTNEPIELTDELVAQLKLLPDIELAKVAKRLVSDDRTAAYFRHANRVNNREREEARSKLCSDLHDR